MSMGGRKDQVGNRIPKGVRSRRNQEKAGSILQYVQQKLIAKGYLKATKKVEKLVR